MNLMINGYGRIGRLFHRLLVKKPRSGFKLTAINSRADAQSHAHLLKYDSTYGILDEKISFGKNYLQVGEDRIKVFQGKLPGEINFKKEKIDYVVECTGKFKDRESNEKQLKTGAKKVIISAPGKGEDLSVVLGVNHQAYQPKKHQIISNASCTTNCLAPVVDVIDKNFEIEYGQMTTIHAVTRSQNILDGSHKKNMRIARSTLESFIPSSTGASKAIVKVFPKLEGKFAAVSIRVPFSTVSMIDLVVWVKKKTQAEKVNQAFEKASQGYLQGILGLSQKPLVSIDYRGDSRSAIVDGLSTSVLGGQLVKVFAWYDNEWGYACRLLDLVEYISKTS